MLKNVSIPLPMNLQKENLWIIKPALFSSIINSKVFFQVYNVLYNFGLLQFNLFFNLAFFGPALNELMLSAMLSVAKQ